MLFPKIINTTWKNKICIRPQIKETLFYRQTDLPSRVGRSGDFFLFMVLKMTPKTQRCRENFDIFCKKYFGKIFRLIFKKLQPKISRLGQKTADFTRFWKNKKKRKKMPKRKFGSVAPVKQVFFFRCLSDVYQFHQVYEKYTSKTCDYICNLKRYDSSCSNLPKVNCGAIVVCLKKIE